MKLKLSIVPFYENQLRNEFFNICSSANRDNALEPFIKLKKILENREFKVNTVDVTPIRDSDFVCLFDLNLKYIIRAYLLGRINRCMYISFEPPVVNSLHSAKNLKRISNLFASVLTWQDDIVDNEKIFKFNFPIPNQSIVTNSISYANKNLITTIVGYKTSNKKDELYSQRIEAIQYFEKALPSNFDLYGKGWDENAYPSYKGSVAEKIPIMSNYKFTLCYENQHNIKGLISEKIFDCFYAESIPIFWGATNIKDYIPTECFIDRLEFEDYSSLIAHLTNMTEDEYNRRLVAIREFLRSDAYKNFSSESFVESIYSTIKLPERPRNLLKETSSIIWLIASKMLYKLNRKLFQGK